MSISIFILLIISSSTMITYSRSLNSSDQLMPFLLSSVTDDNDTDSSSLDNENRLLYTIEHIIKYVSKIKSSENFIDNIMNHQKQIFDKLKILKFLNNCFQITNTIIENEIHRILNLSNTNKKTLFSLSFTLDELQQAQIETNNLLHVIKERMNILKTWIPPTMPFLSF